MRPLLLATLTLLAFGAGGLALAAFPSGRLTGMASATDGDTLRVSGQRVRLVGIDAAETAQTCAGLPLGRLATEAARQVAADGPLSCTLYGTDRHGRALGRCTTAEGRDVAAAVVAAGGAVLYDLTHGWRYLPALAGAVLARRGVWSLPPIELIACPSPARWRQEARTDSIPPVPPWLEHIITEAHRP